MELNKFHISFIIAGKIESEESYNNLKEVNEVPPRFGRNWWYWLPKITKRSKEYKTVFAIHLFCFSFSIDRF